MATRTQVAQLVASRLEKDRSATIKSAAAWLIATGRERQAEYLARDVAKTLANQGYVTIRVTSARQLKAEALAEIRSFVQTALGAQTIEIEQVIDPRVIGGVRIESPEAELDATVQAKLAKLVEGARG